MVASLKSPANPTWVMARIAALLNPYFEKDTPQAVRKIEAEDWADALCGFPHWAIENAVRWWKSADNPDRRKRPLEGDIQSRITIEMDAVNAAARCLADPMWVTKEAVAFAKDMTPSKGQAADIMARSGIGASRFRSNRP
jgi:hypothetical protein